MSLQAGQIIEGKYRIVRLLGEGGMGAVYEGENVRIHRRVAIKVLHPGAAENVDAVQRFEREAQAAGRIGSDHIVEVIDLGNLPEGDRFLVMEYLDGESMSQRILGRGRLTAQEATPLMIQLLEGLGAAHGAGIIHRDLKPDNVYLVRSKKGQTDFVKILDFGISKFNKLNKDSGMSMTRTGAVMGTPYYMSPEQAKGSKEMDHRSDLYSAGVILYEAITGQVPFNAETFNELIFKIVLETPPSPLLVAPDLDPGFVSIVQKAMAREQNDRFQTAQDFATALHAWLGTGQGVAMPAPAPMPAPRAPLGSAPMLAQTPAPWANTGGPGQFPTSAAGVPPKRSAAPVVISIAALAVLGVGGGVAFKMMQKAPSTELVVAPAALVTPASPVPAAQPPEPAKPESTAKPSEPPAGETAPAASSAASAAVPPAAAAALAVKRPLPLAPPPVRRPADKPAAPVAAAPPPAAAPAPAPAPPAAAPAPAPAGRRIRTEL